MGAKHNNLRHEALEFTKLLAEQYFVHRKLEVLPLFLDKGITWIGTGNDEISKNLAEATAALAKELAEYSGSFTVEKQWFEAIPRSDTLCIVYGVVHALPDDDELSEENLRLTLVLEKTTEGMKLIHLHLSHPDHAQEQGHYFVSKAARNNEEDLQNTLDLRSRQLDILNRNIPGGAHQCKNDQDFTLISMSDSFLSMFGYTQEEIAALFHGKFIEMVYPSDRPALIVSTHEQLKKGRDIELEYRVLCKNGAPVWILDKGRLLGDGNGGENFYCLLIEITERKQEQEALRLSLEQHQIIVDQVTDIIFEWDIRRDTLKFSSNWKKRFGYTASETHISQHLPKSENIHAEDITALIKIMKDIAEGVPYTETEFRIKDIANRYYWCRIRATAQHNSEGRPIKAVGVIVDIDSEMRQRQELLDMAQSDALTGLYNKATINTLVKRQMKGRDSSVKQALMILDVDYFKAVNDTYGHLVGDSVLSDVATVIKTQIRSTDLAGRVGGDEFLIYLAEVTDEDAVLRKTKRLLSALEALTPELGAAPISCSVGVAVFPHGTIDYYALYNCADIALYAQKKNGRKGVTFYSPGISEKSFIGDSQSAVGADVGADEGSVMDEQLAQYAFRMLYAAKDIESTINRLLEIIGRSYDVSRVYVFESSEDRKYCSNTFEWCSDGTEPQIATLQNLSYVDDLGDYLKNFDQKGLFYCAEVSATHPDVRAVLERQGIRSMLQCAMLDEGEFVGYVGFDECRENRTWSSRQVVTFKLTADVISTFIMRLRQKQGQNKFLKDKFKGN